MFCVGALVSLKAQPGIEMNDIYTPMGSPVVTYFMYESSLTWRLSLDNEYAQTYPNATQITTHTEQGYELSSTRKFNCHGYAWLRVEQGIDRWIGYDLNNRDPEIYMEDGSYEQVFSETYPGKFFWEDPGIIQL